MRALKPTTTGIEQEPVIVTTQAHEGIETKSTLAFLSLYMVTNQAHEGIETI